MVRKRIPQTRGTWNKRVKGSRGLREGNYYIKGMVVMRRVKRRRNICKDVGEVSYLV